MTTVNIERAVALLKQGEAVAFPTETVYGLGADAWNPTAIQKVFDIKGRPSDNPLIVHVAAAGTVDDFACEIPGAARRLMKQFWPGPLTLIFKKRPEVLDLVTGGLNTVALRWPNHPLAQQLIHRAGPLVAPSANSSGRPSPTRAEHVTDDFGKQFPVIDGGRTQIGLESTVLDVTAQTLTIYRPGYVGKQEIEQITGQTVRYETESASDKPRSPGTKYSHYTPQAAVRWLDAAEPTDRGDALYLLHDRDTDARTSQAVAYGGDYGRMASELYDRFRQADHEQRSSVLIEPFSDRQIEKSSLVRALVNRIDKAIG